MPVRLASGITAPRSAGIPSPRRHAPSSSLYCSVSRPRTRLGLDWLAYPGSGSFRAWPAPFTSPPPPSVALARHVVRETAGANNASLLVCSLRRPPVPQVPLPGSPAPGAEDRQPARRQYLSSRGPGWVDLSVTGRSNAPGSLSPGWGTGLRLDGRWDYSVFVRLPPCLSRFSIVRAMSQGRMRFVAGVGPMEHDDDGGPCGSLCLPLWVGGIQRRHSSPGRVWPSPCYIEVPGGFVLLQTATADRPPSRRGGRSFGPCLPTWGLPAPRSTLAAPLPECDNN